MHYILGLYTTIYTCVMDRWHGINYVSAYLTGSLTSPFLLTVCEYYYVLCK